MSDTLYAQITAGVVVNVIVLNDSTLIAAFSAGFDAFVRVDQLNPQPWTGWTYDGTNFAPPS
jgi:hypothetical protein